MSTYTISGTVFGSTRYPEAPEHEGGWGLVGGEEFIATRGTFHSIGAAMTWCRRVLGGQVTPRHIEWQGPQLQPNTGMEWNSARVTLHANGQHRTWITQGTQWVEEHPNGSLGAVARDDAVYFAGADHE